MNADQVKFNCPACGAGAFQFSGSIDLEKPWICAKCGKQILVTELKTEEGKTPLELAADIAREQFKSIPGFKPSR
jgi:hypothetical protein